jgi:hypothetical protein
MKLFLVASYLLSKKFHKVKVCTTKNEDQVKRDFLHKGDLVNEEIFRSKMSKRKIECKIKAFRDEMTPALKLLQIFATA